ncbi:MAG: iron-containing alcohol dehydrogenase [Proteobacteria bacterium]|nr:iron-containing alcohol dehydrogenase [Pseudomonadota bacterium]
MPEKFTAPSPVRIAFGAGRIDKLGDDLARLGSDRDASRVLLVSDPGVAEAGLTGRVAAVLERAGADAAVFTEVKSDPLAASADAAAAAARSHGAATVVGLGGGSALDIAKLAAAIAPAAEPAEHYALALNPLPRGGLPRILIPTTAGTGSEVTRTSVITSADGRKLWAWGEALRADLAILDPTLTTGLPETLTAATGIDAVVHAIEACTVRRGNPMADAHGLHAIRLIAGNAGGAGSALTRALANPNDLDARGELMIAAALAGIAFDATGTAIAHAMGHALGVLGGVHHGHAVGLCLNAALAWNAEAAPARHAAVARALGAPCDGLDDEDAAALAAPAFDALLRGSGLSLSLADLALDAADLAALTMAPENAPMRDANCREVTKQDALDIALRVLGA